MIFIIDRVSEHCCVVRHTILYECIITAWICFINLDFLHNTCIHIVIFERIYHVQGISVNQTINPALNRCGTSTSVLNRFDLGCYIIQRRYGTVCALQ